MKAEVLRVVTQLNELLRLDPVHMIDTHQPDVNHVEAKLPEVLLGPFRFPSTSLVKEEKCKTPLRNGFTSRTQARKAVRLRSWSPNFCASKSSRKNLDGGPLPHDLPRLLED